MTSPIPGSPTRPTTCPCPWVAYAKRSCRIASSRARPHKPTQVAGVGPRTRAVPAHALDGVHRHRGSGRHNSEAAVGVRPDFVADQPIGGITEHHSVRRGERQQSGGRVGSLTSRRIESRRITVQVSHHDGPGVEPDTDGEGDVLGESAARIARAQPLLQLQRRQHGAPGVIFVRHRGTEQCQKTVSQVLRDRALIALYVRCATVNTSCIRLCITSGPRWVASLVACARVHEHRNLLVLLFQGMSRRAGHTNDRVRPRLGT